MAGGVQPLGRFKEGYCLKANTVNGASNEVWVFCYDTEIKRDDWLEALRIVKLSCQILMTNFNIKNKINL
jgi:hypothetical protein